MTVFDTSLANRNDGHKDAAPAEEPRGTRRIWPTLFGFGGISAGRDEPGVSLIRETGEREPAVFVERDSALG